jgi:uncharacterized NAD(P)/FAD-binding protein YdhS
MGHDITEAAERAITAIERAAWRAVHHHHPHYHPDEHLQPKEGAMSLATIVAAAEKDVKAAEAAVKSVIDTHLPQLGEIAQGIEDSPLVQLALDLAGTIDPAAEQMAMRVLKAIAAESPAPVPVTPEPEPAPA